jgi:uncharacterized membrane protein YukC
MMNNLETGNKLTDLFTKHEDTKTNEKKSKHCCICMKKRRNRIKRSEFDGFVFISVLLYMHKMYMYMCQLRTRHWLSKKQPCFDESMQLL